MIQRAGAEGAHDLIESRADAGEAAELERWLDGVTAEQLQEPAPLPDNDRWPPYARGRSLRHCLGTALGEEFEHHRFCVRDLDLIAARSVSG